MPSKSIKNICPECGEDVTNIDKEAHMLQHWGDAEPDPRLYKEASERYKELERML